MSPRSDEDENETEPTEEEWKPRVPGYTTCLAHFEDEPCSTCAGYIGGGL
jgi:hypothetical protein